MEREYTQEIPTYGDLMTLESWQQAVEYRMFTSWDGTGHYCKDGKMNIDDGVFSSPPLDATHVCWFNK